MENLQTDDLGKLKTIGTTRAFYKTTPCKATDEALQEYSITRNAYLDKFKERAPVSQISKDLFNRLLEQAENKDDLRIYGIEAEDWIHAARFVTIRATANIVFLLWHCYCYMLYHLAWTLKLRCFDAYKVNCFWEPNYRLIYIKSHDLYI